jgi:murein DD-endopeptidase
VICVTKSRLRGSDQQAMDRATSARTEVALALLRAGLLLFLAVTTGACATAPVPAPRQAHSPEASVRARAARTAASLTGTPYRYGGDSPRGFDCSGLVIYSFAKAGVAGLPHSAATLEDIAQPVSLDEIEPGDLLFFQLSKKKTSHVAIYLGERIFVHAPSSGRHVELVSFDHAYWKTRIGRAGRIPV